jgi:hypothetical protein
MQLRTDWLAQKDIDEQLSTTDYIAKRGDWALLSHCKDIFKTTFFFVY